MGNVSVNIFKMEQLFFSKKQKKKNIVFINNAVLKNMLLDSYFCISNARVVFHVVLNSSITFW